MVGANQKWAFLRQMLKAANLQPEQNFGEQKSQLQREEMHGPGKNRRLDDIALGQIVRARRSDDLLPGAGRRGGGFAGAPDSHSQPLRHCFEQVTNGKGLAGDLVAQADIQYLFDLREQLYPLQRIEAEI